LKASIVLATYCPNKDRYSLCERSFSEIHRTGMKRNEYELIVVNNGGIHTDLIERLDADVVITNSKNLGQGAALNEGICIARSKNLALMDDDLSYREGWLQEGLGVLYLHPAHVVSMTDIGHKYITAPAGQGHSYARKVGGIWILRKSVYYKVGRFASGVHNYGGMWTRNLIRSGSRFVVTDTPLIFHLGKGKSLRPTYVKELAHERSGL